MKKPVKQATIAEILHDVCHYEDPDTSLLINTTEDGRVFVSDNEWGTCVVEDTMKKALIKYQLKSWERHNYSKEEAKKLSDEYNNLDWSTIVCQIKEPQELSNS